MGVGRVQGKSRQGRGISLPITKLASKFCPVGPDFSFFFTLRMQTACLRCVSSAMPNGFYFADSPTDVVPWRWLLGSLQPPLVSQSTHYLVARRDMSHWSPAVSSFRGHLGSCPNHPFLSSFRQPPASTGATILLSTGLFWQDFLHSSCRASMTSDPRFSCHLVSSLAFNKYNHQCPR